MVNFDYLGPTRIVCLQCKHRHNTCCCFNCRTKLSLCGKGQAKFPMLLSCKWDTILTCTKFEKE